MLTTNKMTIEAVVCIIFLSFVRLTEGNNVTLLPDGTAYAVAGESLTLECIYSGQFNPFSFNFYLNPDNNGLQIRKSTCGILIATGYNTSLYSHSCNTSSVSLKILTISQSNFDQIWECDVSFITDPVPQKDSTVIKEAITTTVSSTPALSSGTTITTPVTSASSSSTSTSNPTTTQSTAYATSSNTSTATKPATAGSTASSSSSISTSTNPAITGSPGSASSNTSTSTNPATTGSTANATNNISTVTSSTTNNSNTANKSMTGGVDIKVIVPAVVVPGGLVVIGTIILVVVVCIKHHRAGKNVHESPDGLAVQDKGNNVDGWKQSLGHGRVADKPEVVYTTSDGFIIYPCPAAMSAARPNKEKKHHDLPHQYTRPYTETYVYQTAYVPGTYMSARSSTHKDKKYHNVGHPYSRPYTGTSDYQTAYVPSTYMSARTYPDKSKNYDYELPYQIAVSRTAYDQTKYYPQTGHWGQISQDVFHRGSGEYFYGQRSRSHHDHNRRKQQREYYNQYEMADNRGSRAGYRHTKQDTAFYY